MISIESPGFSIISAANVPTLKSSAMLLQADCVETINFQQPKFSNNRLV